MIDLCIEGDKLIEQGTGAVYNKAVKGVRVTKGAFLKVKFSFESSFDIKKNTSARRVFPHLYFGQQHCRAFFTSGVSRLSPHLSHQNSFYNCHSFFSPPEDRIPLRYKFLPKMMS